MKADAEGLASLDHAGSPIADTVESPFLVFGLWFLVAVMAGSLYYLVSLEKFPVPYGDEYLLQEVLTGAQPVTLSWLWEPIYVHRSGVVKLLIYAWARLTHLDLKWAAYIHVSVYLAVACMLLRAARRFRGRYVAADAIIPLVVLNYMNLANIVAILQLQFLIPFAMLAVVFCAANSPKATPAKLVSVCIAVALLAPQCSAFGFIVGAAVFAWMLYYLVAAMNLRERRCGTLLVILIAMIGAVYFALSGPWEIATFHVTTVSQNMHLRKYGGPLTIARRLMNGLIFLSVWSGRFLSEQIALWFGPLEIAAVGALSCLLFKRSRSCPSERIRVASYFMLLAVTAGAAVTIMMGKDAGFYQRYYTLVAPLVIALHLGLEMTGREKVARYGRTVLLLVVLAFTAPCIADGFKLYQDRTGSENDLIAWIRAGEAPRDLDPPKTPGLARFVFPDAQTYLRNIRLLQQAGMAFFRHTRVVFSFQDGVPSRWRCPQGCFAIGKAGPTGERCLNSLSARSRGGRAVSSPFELDHRYVEVRLQGQRGSEYQGVHVIDAESGSLVGEVPAPDSEYPVYRAIDVCAYMGRMARIEIVDERKAGSSGWIGVSSILSTDYPQSVPQ